MLYAVVDERQTGKTELALDLLVRDLGVSVLLAYNLTNGKNIYERVVAKYPSIDKEEIKKRIKSSQSPDALRGYSFRQVILDEAFFFKGDMLTDIIAAAVPLISMNPAGRIVIVSSYRDEIKDKAFLAKAGAKVSDVTNFRKYFELGGYINDKAKKLLDFYDQMY